MVLQQLQNLGRQLTHLFGGQESAATASLAKQEIFAGHPISSLFPYEAYDEEYGIFVNKNSVGFAIEVVPFAGSSEIHQKEINSLFEEILEEEASIQCLLFADHRIEPFLNSWKKQKNNTGEIYREMSEKRTDHFKRVKNFSPRNFRFILSYTIPIKGHFDVSLFQPLKMQKNKILSLFNSLSIAEGWTPKHLLEFVGGLVNFDSTTDLQTREWNPHQTLASQISTGGVFKVKEDHLEWKTEQTTSFKSFRVVNFPTYWSLSSMQHLIGDVLRDNYRIHVPFYLHYVVHCPKQAKADKDFWARSQLIEKQGASHVLRRMNPLLNDELEECSLVRKFTLQGARYVWTQFSAGIWGEKHDLSQAEQTMKSLFRLNNLSLTDNHFLHLPHYLAALPLSCSEYVTDLRKLNLLKTTLTTECGNFVPLQGEWTGNAPLSGMLLMGRRGQLANWNPFNNKSGNYIVAITGKSGSGKSVFMQELLLSGLSAGAKVFILEVGRSFEKLCDLLNGQIIEFSKQSSICLNPFSLIPLEDEDERHTSFSFIKSIVACMAYPNQSISSYELSLLEEAISQAWLSKKNLATISDIAYFLSIQEDNYAKRLGKILRPYTKEGVYAKYFEGKNNINFTNPMVWIELEELKEKKDLQSVVLQLIIMTITNQAFLGDRKTPFYICIDEAWDLLRGNQTGVFIETLARRLRKYYGSLVIGTQGIDDFYATPGAQAAFENSDWTCFLSSQSSSTLLNEKGKLKFDEYQLKALDSLTKKQGAYSEVMICDNNGGYAISRLILDRFSQLLYSTEAREYSKLKELKAKGLSIAEAINHLIEEPQT